MRAARASEAADAELLAYLTKRTGLVLSGSRRGDIATGLARVRRRFGIEDEPSFLVRIRHDPRLFEEVVSEITVGETYFMRDPAQFEAVRRVILPTLVQSRPASADLKIWSAGCSTGEEAYSLAIIAEEEGLAARCIIMGTDLSATAIARARQGHYGAWALRGEQKGRLQRYFRRDPDGLTLEGRLRERVRFERLNLASNIYPSPSVGIADLDLILCRNVLIYFDAEAVERVAARMHASLAEGGWLVTGPSDPPLWRLAPFRTVIVPGAVLYQRADGAADTPSPARSNGSSAPPKMGPWLRTTGASGARAGPVPAPPRQPKKGPDAMAQGRAERTGQGDAQAADELVRAGRLSEAEQMLAAAIADDPLTVDIRYARGLLLAALERDDEAIREMRSILFIDRTLAAAHLTLGLFLAKRGDIVGARRSFERSYRLSAGRPADEAVTLCPGETAGSLASGALAQLARHGGRNGPATRTR